ncbi:hypothetical protein ACLOJK_018516 [Asimina triloba]
MQTQTRLTRAQAGFGLSAIVAGRLQAGAIVFVFRHQLLYSPLCSLYTAKLTIRLIGETFAPAEDESLTSNPFHFKSPFETTKPPHRFAFLDSGLRSFTSLFQQIMLMDTCLSEGIVECRDQFYMMDNIVDSLNNAYQEFVAAAAGVLEAKELSGDQKTAVTDTALEKFKQQWELFRVACDQAEEFIESVKQRIGSECLVDEATGSVATRPGQASAGLPPISAVRLEQMSKAVRWLVIELQHGSGAASASHTHSSAPFDARFPEDATQ